MVLRLLPDMRQHVRRLSSLLAVATALLLHAGCDPGDPTEGTLRVVDTLRLDKSGMGLTAWGPRFTERNGQTMIYLIDDAGLYREFSAVDGQVTDSIDLGAQLEKQGFDRYSTISSLVWMEPGRCLLTLLRPEPGFVLYDAGPGSSQVIQYADSLLHDPPMIPGAQPSILEPFVVQENRVAIPMQLMVGNIFGDANARLRRYSVAPISVYVLDADGKITAIESRGRFPDMYRDSAIRVMSYACARDGNHLYLAFGRDHLIYRYDLTTGDPVDSLSRPMPVAFDHVPFNADDNTSRAFREYYHQVSRSHALKVLAPGVLARTFVKGEPLPKDSVITRSYDAMDWIIATYGADGSALFCHVNGQEYLNTFFENIGSDVYLLSSASSDDEIVLVRAELVDA